MAEFYRKQRHIFQTLDLRNTIYSLPAQPNIPVVGGAVGATVDIPVRTVRYIGTNMVVYPVVVNVDGDVGATLTVPLQTVPVAAYAFTVPAQNGLPVLGGGGGTVDVAAYAAQNTTVNQSTILPVNAFIDFKIKEIRFSFSYQIVDLALPNFTVSTPLTNGDIVGNLNKFSLTDGNFYYYSDGFKKLNEFSYIFQDPIKVWGSVPFTFYNLNHVDGNTLNAIVVVHMEFLG